MSGSITNASAGPNGLGNGDSYGAYGAALSADGSKVVFGNSSATLPSGGATGAVFVEDVATGQYTLVSTGPAGSANGGSTPGSISADGTKVVFNSTASNLVADDTKSNLEVFLKDLATGAVTLVSAGAEGPADGFSSGGVISADGTKVAFSSSATNLVPGDTNGLEEVFVKDLVTGAVTLVSTGPAGQANVSSDRPSISADGSKVAFSTQASNLVPGDTNGETDIYVKDLTTGAITRASGDPGGVPGASASFAPALSADGSKVAYSVSVGFGGSQQSLQNVYVTDLATGAVTLVSTGPAGIGNSFSGNASVSADGSKVAFESDASNLVTGDTNARSDVFIKDLGTGAITLATLGINGPANGSSFHPSLSADGTKVAFESGASNLVPGDTNNQSDVFVESLATPVTPVVTPVAITVGAGPDQLVLKISQDAYLGSAQYTIAVDGKQVGDTLTASALHRQGQDDTITVNGYFGPGAHTLAVDFLNDAFDGTTALDRNLYLDAVTYDGVPQPGSSLNLYASGVQSTTFSVPQGTSTTVGAGQDGITLRISEDAFQGDAQYTISVDGQQVGGVFTATALHGTGYYDTVSIKGTYGYSAHSVTVNFLNDAYGGSPAADRNLYVEGIQTSAGGLQPNSQAALNTSGPRDFSLTGPTTPNVKIWLGGAAGDSLYDPLNWTPGGTPQSTDQLYIPTGTVNVDGGNAAGAVLWLQPFVLPGDYPSSVSSTATLNLRSASVNVRDSGGDATPVYSPPYPAGPSINAFGASSLSADFSGDRIYGFVFATINVAENATLSLVGNGLSENYSRVSINGAAGAQLENDSAVVLQSNATLTINADTVGVGSFAPGYATTLEFAGAVGSGQAVKLDSLSPATVDVDHPGTFQAALDWQASVRVAGPTVDLRGLVADSFDYSNDLLTLYSGNQVVDATRLIIRPATDTGAPGAPGPYETLHVAQGTDGVLLTLATASAAPGLPVHV